MQLDGQREAPRSVGLCKPWQRQNHLISTANLKGVLNFKSFLRVWPSWRWMIGWLCNRNQSQNGLGTVNGGDMQELASHLFSFLLHQRLAAQTHSKVLQLRNVLPQDVVDTKFYMSSKGNWVNGWRKIPYKAVEYKDAVAFSGSLWAARCWAWGSGESAGCALGVWDAARSTWRMHGISDPLCWVAVVFYTIFVLSEAFLVFIILLIFCAPSLVAGSFAWLAAVILNLISWTASSLLRWSLLYLVNTWS